MSKQMVGEELLATVDVKQLSSLGWGPLRLLFPAFADEVELGRFLNRLLQNRRCRAVRIEPHRAPDGGASTHVFDVFAITKLDA